MNDWYVYRHVRLDTNQPFYIGIGNKKNYARAFEKNKSKRNKIWNYITSKTSFEVEVLLDGLTKEQASIKEMEFISLYGRLDLDTGCLCNLTDGGDGIWNCKVSLETREKIRRNMLGSKNHRFGTKQSEETKLRRSVASTGNKRSEETKKRQSISSIKSGQAKTTEVFDLNGNKIGVYHSISEACRSVGMEPKMYSGKASMVANNKRKQCKGYIFKYV